MMVQLKAIDVAIGVIFLYLLLTFIASALVEILSTIRNWRAEMLHDAIGNMLAHSPLVTVGEIYANPLVLALCRNNAAPSLVDLVETFGWRPLEGGTPPSYIPPATFSGAVLETLIDNARREVVLSPEGVIALIRGLLNERPMTRCPCCARQPEQDALRSILETTLATQGASIQAVRFALEKWFSDTMDRTAGWYKRRTQSCLFLVGLAMGLGANLSTIAVARWLWDGDAARQAAVSAAIDFVHQHPITQPTTKDHPTPDFTSLGKSLFDINQQVNELQYPIGWPPRDLPRIGLLFWLPQYLVGVAITAVAISMGSSFWFDALQGLIKMRGTGPRPSS
jgi:hypothetical protein